MKLSVIGEMLDSLDGSYRVIAEEHASAGGGAAPPWESIVRGRPRREAGTARGDLRCAAHMAPHGLTHDALSDHLAAEIGEWVRLADKSPTARAALQIERIAPSSGARLAVVLHSDRDLELRLRLSATGDAVVPTRDGDGLWWQKTPSRIEFRRGPAAGEAHLMFSNDGKGRRWSFTEVRKGYEDYLHARGMRPDEAAISELTSCPTPRLLGMVSEHNHRESAERAAIALSEVALWTSADGEAGSLVGPCPACRFGLGAWLCGHEEVLTRGAVANLDYAKAREQWLTKLRDREAPGPRTGRIEGVPPPGQTTSHSAPPVVQSGPASQGAAATASSTPIPRSNPPRKERVRVRLESEAFSCEEVEIAELTGKEQLTHGTFVVSVVSFDEDGLDVGRVLGAKVAVVLGEARGGGGSAASSRAPQGEVRRVEGVVSEMSEVLNTEPGWTSYRLWIETSGADSVARREAVSAPLRTQGEATDVFDLEVRSRRTLGPGDEDRTYFGKSDRGQIAPGVALSLTGHRRLEGTGLFVVEVEHHARQSIRGSRTPEEPYRNRFRAVDARREARAIRAAGRGAGFDG